MANSIGIRLEDKNQWERRVPLVPEDTARLAKAGFDIRVEQSPKRVFNDDAYRNLHIQVARDVRSCDIVLGVKEMPKSIFREGGAYMFFSHTIKGQPYNMDMLAALVESRSTLFDYELVTDDRGRRLIFFGRYAGLAGMIDTLWTLGKRLDIMGYKTPFLKIEPAHRYRDLEQAKTVIAAIGAEIASTPLPEEISPLVVGITGYGNVSIGAQEILDLLPHVEINPDNLGDFVTANRDLRNRVGKVIFREKHLVKPIDPAASFDLSEYYEHGERYESTFAPHLDNLSVLVNGIYWDERYPKLADAETLKTLFEKAGQPRLIAVGDITCDIDGSLACTMRDTEPGDPVFVYNPVNREAPSGFDGSGIAVMAVGNLPAELPKEASQSFSDALTPFIPDMAKADLTQDFDGVSLPDPIRRSAILWQGKFTPTYKYMREFLLPPLKE